MFFFWGEPYVILTQCVDQCVLSFTLALCEGNVSWFQNTCWYLVSLFTGTCKICYHVLHGSLCENYTFNNSYLPVEKKNALILVYIMLLVGSDESTVSEEKPRVSLWETESLTTFPMYPTAFFQTEASMGFRAAIYAWHFQWFQEWWFFLIFISHLAWRWG